MKTWQILLSVVLLYGCATTDEMPAETQEDAAPEEEQETSAAVAAEEMVPLLDRTQRTVYNLINSTSKRVDAFFGATDVESDENVSRGRLTAGYFWDERDASDTSLRLKARVPLPAMKQRGRLIIGRGNADDLIDGTDNDDIDPLPARFDDLDEDDWVLGFGYNRQGGIAKGWDLGVGVQLKTPLEPYVRATYRWNRVYGDSWLWRVHPRVFWQSQRGAGASLTNIVDKAYAENWMFRSWTILQGEQEVEGLGWTQRFLAYQALQNSDALSYAIFANGETDNEVPIQNYGIELRYRRQVAREWFFIVFSTVLDWPREFLTEQRESNLGFGIEFEMQFGDWPGRKQELGGTPPEPADPGITEHQQRVEQAAFYN